MKKSFWDFMISLLNNITYFVIAVLILFVILVMVIRLSPHTIQQSTVTPRPFQASP